MININKSDFVGKGNHREVYRHPDDPQLCLKVNISSDLTSREKREQLREKSYYSLLKKKGVSFSMLPAYHGDVETNLGTASVFNLMSDTDGSTSRTLGYYLKSEELTQQNYDGLLSSLALLKEYLLSQKIIVRGLAHRNIVCQRNGSGIYNLAIVDNIGNSEFIPISNYVDFLAERKIHKKWQRFEKRQLEEFTDNTALRKIFEAL
jgi:hypothetical protein